ncbi:hypothetical protein ACFFTN_06180 [Aminobacter aganoensis]|uniref:Uncharacterized protein n=1 Tax=Aminobacter aganoensis TaxID=83264 RepID=A0A7X0F4T8_9HYPH|nr:MULTISPECIES: hypothetical protein [Aminobacter]KQU65861.1 hypothetical protein ASC75_11720 [Aminobacter sp. DSM 101952]MBB6353072.1 hypothetical protein [Aminobacter aganoensis]
MNVREPLADRLAYVATYFETYTDEKLDSLAEAEFRKKVIGRKDREGDSIPDKSNDGPDTASSQ